MAKVNNSYRKNIKAFWKFVDGSIKSSVMNRIESLTDGSGSSFYAVMVKTIKSPYEKLGSELDMKSFEDSWKEEVSNSVTLFETMYF